MTFNWVKSEIFSKFVRNKFYWSSFTLKKKAQCRLWKRMGRKKKKRQVTLS